MEYLTPFFNYTESQSCGRNQFPEYVEGQCEGCSVIVVRLQELIVEKLAYYHKALAAGRFSSLQEAMSDRALRSNQCMSNVRLR